jgi:hypothetical protein
MQGSYQRTKGEGTSSLLPRHLVTARPGDTVELVRETVAENRRAYVLVNNCSEGNVPLTVQALSEMLQTRSSVPATVGRG